MFRTVPATPGRTPSPTSRCPSTGKRGDFAWREHPPMSTSLPHRPGRSPPTSRTRPTCAKKRPKASAEVCDSLDHFLSTFSLQETVLGCPNLFSTERDASPDGIAGLEPSWLNGKYVSDEATHDFFGVNGTDLLILRHANEGIMIA